MDKTNPHPAMLDPEVLFKQCRLTTTRRGGPGGQHRNKVESAVVLEHQSTNVVAEANERRSQAENREVALFRLRVNLALAIRIEKSQIDELLHLWQKRTQNNRLAINPQHEDFPSLLAESLDWIHFFDFELKNAANRLQISSSQLIKFLKLEKQALKWVNDQREKKGLHRLK